MEKDYEKLRQYLSEKAVEPVYQLIVNHKVQLVITRQRRTKLGDYRPGLNGNYPRISLNYNLNPYSFLLTFLHELAHHLVWIKYRNRVSPHGTEWKAALKNLQKPFLSTDFFPMDILEQLQPENAPLYAAASADTNLARILRKYDPKNNNILLETIPENTLFCLADGRRFQKLGKRRKNYICRSLDNNRNYIFNPLAEVYLSD
ncbi:MAG TPA: SprT-like domain-containing protein [Bacteroidales bacterium]|nr:SprT-like domain-containing protein [Bacteroidales bacterium]